MARNKMTDLRNHLFEVIERLKNPEEEDSMDVHTAKAIVNAAQVIVNSAKLESDLIRHLEARGTGFFELETEQPRLLNPKTHTNGHPATH